VEGHNAALPSARVAPQAARHRFFLTWSWPVPDALLGLGVAVYFLVALMFLMMSGNEIARGGEGHWALAVVAALFWPLVFVAIVIVALLDRRD
jgi:hypothetical protein